MNKNLPSLLAQASSLTLAQQKSLASAMRIKILHALSDIPHTSKQVADILGESPGNIHYHLQRLSQVNLIELVKTREINGIVEKYYKASNTRFYINSDYEVVWKNNFSEADSSRVLTQLLLTDKDKETLIEEIAGILEKWEKKTRTSSEEDLSEFRIEVFIGKDETKEDV